MIYVVEFPHPEGSTTPGSAGLQPWGVRRHGRKFLKSHGRYLGEDGLLRDDDLVFWEEWEPP